MIRSVPYSDQHPLVVALSDEMIARYGGGPAPSADPSRFLPPYGVFLVARVDDQDVACGGLRLHRPGIGEIKRMYVAPAFRKRGLSRQLLRALIDHAGSVGLDEVWIETGLRQPEAIALYESEGFEPITPYGDYKDEPESRCFRLSL